MRPGEAVSHRGTSARRGSPVEEERMPTDTTPWSLVRQKAAKWFQATKPRRVKRTTMGTVDHRLVIGRDLLLADVHPSHKRRADL